jgi:hypothetical protein
MGYGTPPRGTDSLLQTHDRELSDCERSEDLPTSANGKVVIARRTAPLQAIVQTDYSFACTTYYLL